MAYINIPSGLCSSLSGNESLDDDDKVVWPADMLRLIKGSSKLRPYPESTTELESGVATSLLLRRR